MVATLPSTTVLGDAPQVVCEGVESKGETILRDATCNMDATSTTPTFTGTRLSISVPVQPPGAATALAAISKACAAASAQVLQVAQAAMGVGVPVLAAGSPQCAPLSDLEPGAGSAPTDPSEQQKEDEDKDAKARLIGLVIGSTIGGVVVVSLVVLFIIVFLVGDDAREPPPPPLVKLKKAQDDFRAHERPRPGAHHASIYATAQAQASQAQMASLGATQTQLKAAKRKADADAAKAAKPNIASRGAAAAAAEGAAEVAMGGARAGGLFTRLRNRSGQSAAQLANPAARGLLTSAFAGEEEEEEGPAQARAGRGGRGRVGPEESKPVAAADGSFAAPLAAPGEGRMSVGRGGGAIPAGVLKVRGHSKGAAGDDVFAPAQPKEIPEYKPRPVPQAQPGAKTGVKLDLVKAPIGQRRSSTAAVVGSPHGGGAGGPGQAGSAPNAAVFQALQPVGSGAISGRFSANMPSPTMQNRPSSNAASPLQGNRQSGMGNTQQKL